MTKLFLLHLAYYSSAITLSSPRHSFPIQPSIKAPPKPLTRVIKPQLPIHHIINLLHITFTQFPLSLDRVQILQDPAFRL